MNTLTLACTTAILALASLPQRSSAAVIFNLDEFTGDDSNVTVRIQNIIGGVQVSAVVNESPNTGDLIGLFFSINPFTGALTFNSVSGGPVTDSLISEDDANNLGGGNNVNPSPAASGGFDFAVTIGDPGIGQGDDFQTTAFNVLGNISETDFTEVAARVTSVGLPDGPRNGSSKLFSNEPMNDPNDPDPVPEPSTYMLVATGLVVGGVVRRRALK